MMGDRLIQAMATMDTAERRAYSTGISDTYAEVFAIFTEASRQGGADLVTLLTRISASWDDVRNTQIVKGVL
jgi:hypothetical protein